MFSKILIANRGEIAIRVLRTAKAMGIKTVAVYAAIEKDALHVRLADEAYCLGQESLADTYLNVDKVLEVARRSGAQAIHPGYGFLSENPALVKGCETHGITFIGPSSEVMQLMGNKVAARKFAKQIGIPVVDGVVGQQDEILAKSDTFTYPVLVKAAAGGGGKGMRIVREPEALQEALEATSREAKAYFSDATVYVEQYLEEPRHIEVQLLGDSHSHIVHLFERECSVQRRYQKIIEEAPSLTLTDDLRQKICEAAVHIGKETGYTSAGTIEFLLDKQGQFYFLEMNTRIQVEHPVTELTTGVDIVREQINIASGLPVSFAQDNITQQGHAIECRIYAESPEDNFMPSPGDILYYHAPHGENIRLDTAIVSATKIDSRYDPMIGKLIAYGQNRQQATQRLLDALKAYTIHGIATNIPFLIQFLQLPDFKDNRISTKYCDTHLTDILTQMKQAKSEYDLLPVMAGGLLFNYQPDQSAHLWYQMGFWRHIPAISFSIDGAQREVLWKKRSQDSYRLHYQDKAWMVTLTSSEDNVYHFLVDDQRYVCFISENEHGSLNITYKGFNYLFKRNDILGKESYVSNDVSDVSSANQLVSPMPGKVIKLHVQPGDEVKKGSVLLIVEAMKMENNIVAPRDATVQEIFVSEQEMVERHKPLILLA